MLNSLKKLVENSVLLQFIILSSYSLLNLWVYIQAGTPAVFCVNLVMLVNIHFIARGDRVSWAG